MVRRYTYRDHVLRDVLTELDPSIISTRDEVDAAVIGGDVEHDVRILPRECSELWGKDRFRSQT